MKKRILLTGGTGDVGRAAVAHLIQRGYPLVVIGRTPGKEIPGADYVVCDVGDADRFNGIVKDARPDAIVHLAAIRSPMLAPPGVTLRDNLVGMINAYQAAEDHDIDTVVAASSINALGFKFGAVPFRVENLPVDESHPSHTTDPYSFSKETGEAIGHYYARRSGIRGTGLRLPWVYHHKHEERFRENLPGLRESAARLRALPVEDRREYAIRITAEFDALRTTTPTRDREPMRELIAREPLLHLYGDLWTAVHDEDSARSIELSLTAEYTGFNPLFIMEASNVVGIESEFLAETFFPDTPRRPLVGCESLISSERARELIGWEPVHAICAQP